MNTKMFQSLTWTRKKGVSRDRLSETSGNSPESKALINSRSETSGWGLTMGAGLLLLFSVLIFSACSPEADEKKEEEGEKEPKEELVVVQDHMGEEIKFETHPEHVVSMMPNLTETLYALDLDESVVGVSNLCDYPEKVEEQPRVGDAFSVNIEKIATLEPDVVLMGVGDIMADVREQLEEMAIQSVAFSPQDIDEIQEMILTMGEIFDREAAAESIITEMDEQREKLKTQVSQLDDKPSVFVLLDTESLYTVGEGEFMHEVIQVAGGKNVAAEAGTGYFEMSQEKLLELDPEVIITTFADTSLEEKGALENLTAVQEGNLYTVDGNLLSRPGPRIMEGAWELHDLIHE